MKAADTRWDLMRSLLLLALALISMVCVACNATQVEMGNKGVYPKVDFPTTGYGYGNAFHLLFSYDGDPKLATEWRHVSERGIADDPRVQEFVDSFRDTLAEHSFVVETTDFREARALAYLNEPVYRGGFRLADAEETTRTRNGKLERYYQWRGSDGQFTAGAFADELPTIGNDFGGRWRFANSLRAVYGRPDLEVGYADFLQLYVAYVANWGVAFNATEPRHLRNSEQFKYGVMGIMAREDAARPQGLVQHVIVEISTQPNSPAAPIDRLIIEALNASLGDGEVIQFYPHSALDQFGDTDERVRYFKENTTKSVMIKEVQRQE